MSEQKTPAVYEAWAGVCEDMARGGIGKNRTGNGYKFRGIDDVLHALSSSFVAHRLSVRALYTDHVVVPHTPKGFDARCSAEYHLVSTVDGSTVGPFRFVAEAFDVGDKATNKTMSIAYKYFAIQTFAIPTEGVLEDEEPNAPDSFGPPRGAVATGGGVDEDRARAPKPAQPDDFRAIQVTWGPDKGKTIGHASDAGLEAWAARIKQAVDDPSNSMPAQERARATNTLDAVKRELGSR